MDRTVPHRTVKTRKIEFEYPADRLPRHYISGDLVMSHIVTVLSSFFPEGEDFFVRTVRNYRDQIDDPELKAQVAGFIGQEVTHGREHRNFNKRLATMGYPTRAIDRSTRRGLRIAERVLPKRVQLAITAALEHYTATLAEILLTDPKAREMFDVDEVRSMFQWHALEESEHKAVAFDVYQAVSGNSRVRIRVMRFVTFDFLLASILWTIVSMLGDRDTYKPHVLIPSLRRLRHSPWLSRDVARRIAAYNRPAFHPDDYDNAELTETWKARLFGADGPLTDRLSAAGPQGRQASP
jgi:predicted metal-dependent hydrolase